MRPGINNSSFSFFFTWRREGSGYSRQSSSNVHGKTDFSREHYHFSRRGLHQQCADYRFESPARQVIKSQDPAAPSSRILSALRFPYPPGRRWGGQSSGEKTPLTKVNSHDQSLFAGAKSTDRYFIHELLPRVLYRDFTINFNGLNSFTFIKSQFLNK